MSVHPSAAGTRLGPWRLLRLLGEGGMGEVWLAERADGLYESQVAIKLLRGDLTGPGLAARFARERALLARLKHPGIAPLLDAGLAGERAYLVLEYIEGLTLSEHVRARALPVAARVELLLGVARAVEHAHAQLVVHRDLKPGNVMVTPEGLPKLLDFGIAGLLDDEGEGADSLLTRQAGRRLTPSYAAPEQITGAPIGVAADVYSLGVMLYELLSGVLPFGLPGSSREALEHAVLHTEPLRLSRTRAADALDPGRPGPGRPPDGERAHGDLEAVAAKALRKQPGQRYGNVGALIDDLERWLAHRPVSARKDDWRHRSRLWLRRHARLALAISAVLLSLGGGLALSLWQWQRAERAARQSEQVTDYLGELLGSANPERHGGRIPSVMDLLEKNRRELDQRFAAEPEVHLRLLEVLMDTYRNLSRFDIAIPLDEQQLALSRAQWGEHDPRTQDAQLLLARAYTSQGAPVQAAALLEPLRAALIQRFGEASPEHASLMYMLISAYAKLGRFAEAEAVIAEARPLEDRVHRPGSFEHAFFANYVHGLRWAQGRWREAEALLEATRPTWAGADPHYAQHVLALRRNLLVVQLRRLREVDLQAQLRDLFGAMEALLGPGNQQLIGLRHELTRVFIERGDYRRALAEQQAVAAALQQAAIEHPSVQLPHQGLLLLAQALADPGAARAPTGPLFETLAATRAISGPARAELWLTLARIGLLQEDSALAQRAIDRLRSEPDLGLATHPGLASRVAQIDGELARRLGQLPRSRELLARRVAYFDSLGEAQYLPAWAAQLDLAMSLVALRDPQAGAALARADALRPAGLAGPHPFDALRRELGRGRVPAGQEGRF
jgi:eukaryotic-like serine/threonine-protein kinase